MLRLKLMAIRDRDSKMLLLTSVFAGMLASLLTGCGSGVRDVALPSRGVSLNGYVYSGQAPIARSSVQLYSMGDTGTGSASTPLLKEPVQTSTSGAFTLPAEYSCASDESEVYLLARGGQTGAPNAQSNAAITLLAALGPCGHLSNAAPITINEVTTVGTVWPLLRFIQSPTHIGSAAVDSQALDDAVQTVQQLVNTATGTTPGPSLPTDAAAPIAKLNTMANVVSSCVSSSGGTAGDGTACGKLFACAKVQGTEPPRETLSAALAIAKNPTDNVEAIFDQASAEGPFLPLLPLAPIDWRIPVVALPPTPVVSPASGRIEPDQAITITDASPSAAIYYTQDGSLPNAASLKYFGPIQATKSFTIRAVAILDDVSSLAATASFQVAQPVSVATTPSSVSLGPSKSQAFAAVVKNARDTSVSWSLLPAIGSISPAGLYTAPTSISAPQQVSVIATSVADKTKQAIATVSLIPPVVLTISPPMGDLGPAQSLGFSAAANGAASTAVTWSITPAIGTITPSGVYTAPASLQNTQSVTITATTMSNNAVSAVANVLLFPVNPAGLVGSWPLNEGGGTTALDRSGNGRDGTWSGGQTGNLGYYVGASGSYSGAFDGSTTAVNLGQLVMNLGAVTMSAWVRQTSIPSSNPLIFGTNSAAIYSNPGEGNVWIHLKAGNQDHYLGRGTDLAQWHLATMTYDGTTVSFYLDGSLVNSEAASGTAGIAGALAIGSTYPGLINGVQMYRRALSNTEVQQLYSSGYAVPSAPTAVNAVAGDNTALVSFGAPLSNGGSAIIGYTVTAHPGNVVVNSTTATPVTVAGLVNGTPYTFTVTATSSLGSSAASTASNPIVPSPAAVIVNWNALRQTIDGFGASDAFTYPPLTPAQADLFFSTTNGVGLSLLRTQVPNDGSCASINGACAGAVSDMQLAAARGARIWSTPWSPPAGMSSNGSTDCTVTSSPSHLLQSAYGAYAKYLSNYIASVRQTTGVPLYALSIQNEPDFCASYGGMIWNGEAFHDFLRTLGPTLNAAGQSSTKLMLPETGGSDNFKNLAITTMSDPSTAAYAGLLAYHGYDNSQSFTNPYTSSGANLWETEVCGTFTAGASSPINQSGSWDPSMNDALEWAQVINHNLVDVGVSAWHYWWLINEYSDDNEGLMHDGVASKRLYVMGNYSKFVRPGWMRIDATTNPATGIYISAFRDPSTGNFAIVAINTNDSTSPVTVSFNGMRPGPTVVPWVTSATQDLVRQTGITSLSSGFSAEIAPNSVTTFTGSATGINATHLRARGDR